jgi:hypothetical protein
MCLSIRFWSFSFPGMCLSRLNYACLIPMYAFVPVRFYQSLFPCMPLSFRFCHSHFTVCICPCLILPVPFPSMHLSVKMYVSFLCMRLSLLDSVILVSCMRLSMLDYANLISMYAFDPVRFCQSHLNGCMCLCYILPVFFPRMHLSIRFCHSCSPVCMCPMILQVSFPCTLLSLLVSASLISMYAFAPVRFCDLISLYVFVPVRLCLSDFHVSVC